MSVVSFFTFIWVFLKFTNAFYLPGVAPKDYYEGDQVNLLVNSFTPLMGLYDQQLKSIISYDFYHPQFHSCEPEGGPKKQSESLGSILFGDRIFNSPFDIKMMGNQECKLLCQSSIISKEDAKFINDRIRENYAYNWLIDGLPAAREMYDKDDNVFYSNGFELGQMISSSTDTSTTNIPTLHNHFDMIIEYHTNDDMHYRVVGVLVRPLSILSSNTNEKLDCKVDKPMILSESENSQTIQYTYSITWKRSATRWATRWDKYLHIFDPKIHWFSLINSVVIVLFLTGMVAMILMRALHKDITRYNHIDLQEDVQEDFGWKLVHGEIFRSPSNIMLLSIMLGTGGQLAGMAGITLVFALLGFLSPSSRGALATMMIIFYTLFGCFSGYISAIMYNSFGGESWKRNIFFTATLFPSVIFSMFFFLNFFLIASEAAGAVPLGTMIALIALWFLISVPLSCVGSYFGFKRGKYESPVRTNQIPRQIPDQPFYLRPIPSMFMGGVLPFGAVFIELYFIMNSIWFHKIYYVFGFLFLCFGVMFATCSTVTILMCYFHLCAENYNWWWRSFFTGGASVIYLILYSFIYYASKLHLTSFTSTVLYFGYTLMISLMWFILTGTIGFFACFMFVRKIYGSIKID